MRFAPSSFPMIAFMLSLGAVALGARTAHAVPCCSSEICQRPRPPAICNLCTPTCVDDEGASGAGEVVYDEAEFMCYVAGDVEPSEGSDGELAARE